MGTRTNFISSKTILKVLLIILVLLANSSGLVNASLTCETRDSCPAGETCTSQTNCIDASEKCLFSMFSLSNSHAETCGQSYPYDVCCSLTSGKPLDVNVENTLIGYCNAQEGQAGVISLFDLTNSHVEGYTGTSTAYINDICLSTLSGESAGTIVCEYVDEPDCSSLGPEYGCVASISGDTNAHIADCNPVDAYTKKVCCVNEHLLIVDKMLCANKDDINTIDQYCNINLYINEYATLLFTVGDPLLVPQNNRLLHKGVSAPYESYVWVDGRKGETYPLKYEERETGALIIWGATKTDFDINLRAEYENFPDVNEEYVIKVHINNLLEDGKVKKTPGLTWLSFSLIIFLASLILYRKNNLYKPQNTNT